MYLPDVITYKVLISKGGYINQKLVILKTQCEIKMDK